jgi:hypothetical protein
MAARMMLAKAMTMVVMMPFEISSPVKVRHSVYFYRNSWNELKKSACLTSYLNPRG